MKTTIDIADPILRSAKRLAAKEGTTLKAIVEDALRAKVEQSRQGRTDAPLLTHTFKGRGLRSGVSLDDWSSIRALVYEGRGG